MATAAASVALAGATGLVGSQILNVLKSLDSVTNIVPFSRRELPTDDKVKPVVAKDSSQWAEKYPSSTDIFFSSLGTTRANAGGFEAQRKIDHDLNLELAKAARARGTKVMVLISSSGANSASMFPYMKMKGEIENAIKAIDFEHVVIVRPGLIVGQRTEMRTAEFVLRKIATFAGSMSGNRLKDFWAQDDLVIARAAVRAGLDALNGQEKEKVKVLAQADVVRLGKTEWKQ